MVSSSILFLKSSNIAIQFCYSWSCPLVSVLYGVPFQRDTLMMKCLSICNDIFIFACFIRESVYCSSTSSVWLYTFYSTYFSLISSYFTYFLFDLYLWNRSLFLFFLILLSFISSSIYKSSFTNIKVTSLLIIFPFIRVSPYFWFPLNLISSIISRLTLINKLLITLCAIFYFFLM